MKRLLILLIALLSCSTKTETKIYDYSDVTTMISWDEIFIQEGDDYLVYFYSETCGHCLELKEDILSYYFSKTEIIYFVNTNEGAVFGPKSDLTEIDSIESFYIFGTPFLIHLYNHKVENYYSGVNKIREYIEYKMQK